MLQKGFEKIQTDKGSTDDLFINFLLNILIKSAFLLSQRIKKYHNADTFCKINVHKNVFTIYSD